MSATTVNAFPPLHAFNSSRSWFLALIVLLHAGFFWVLTHGVDDRQRRDPAAGDRRFPARQVEAQLPKPPRSNPSRRKSSIAWAPRSDPAAPGRSCRRHDLPSRHRLRSRRAVRLTGPGLQAPVRAGHRRAARSIRAFRLTRARVSGLGNPAGARGHGMAVGARSCRTGASARCASISRAATCSSMNPRCAKRASGA